jgi:hypothetical protein
LGGVAERAFTLTLAAVFNLALDDEFALRALVFAVFFELALDFDWVGLPLADAAREPALFARNLGFAVAMGCLSRLIEPL